MYLLMFSPTTLLPPSLTSDDEENDFVTNSYNMLNVTWNKSKSDDYSQK